MHTFVAVKVVAKDFAAKYSDKQECFHFLTHDCGAYLSSYDTMTIWHLKELASGARKRIKASQIKHFNVPHFTGLTIKTMTAYAKMFPEVIKCLPIEEKEWEKLPR